MDLESYLRFAAAFLLVIGLIAAAAWAARRFGLAGRVPLNVGRSRRLAVVEVTALDPRHRLMLVRRDNLEHLLLIGPAGSTVVERGIEAPPAEPAS